MGTSYRYRCPKCGFEHEYFTGGGFLTDDYYAETDRLEKELRSDILKGKHGSYVKKLLEMDTGNDLKISCETELFQCLRCRELLVWRDKNIWLNEDHCTLRIEIEQECPSCGSSMFWKVEGRRPVCPNCKDEVLELAGIGKWD